MMSRRIAVVSLAICLVLGAAIAHAEKWRFVVAGDGRSNGINSQRPEDKNGVNVKVCAALRDAMLAEKPDVLLWTGDLVYGDSNPSNFKTQLDTWMDVMRPLWEAGIEVLAVRGNHELRCAESERIWNEVFSGKYALPKNGPANAKNLSYFAFRHNAMFIGVDQYVDGKSTLPMNWLSGVLSGKKSQHVFAFGHEMAFMAGNHLDCLDAHESDRDAFWRLLISSGSRAYFAGHDHFYDHMAVTDESGRGELHQFVAGTAGAPFYQGKEYGGKNGTWKRSRVKHLDNTYGYLVVDVDGARAQITFMGQHTSGGFVSMDSWSYVAGQ